MNNALDASSNVCIISDAHLGIKKANDLFLNSQLDFFKNQFEPYLRQHNIKKIFFLGDVFDNRVFINIKIKNQALDLFENILKNYKIYLIVGNHDCYYNNNIEINSLKFLGNLNNVSLIEKNTLIECNNKKIYMVPWITNEEEFLKQLNELNKDIDICMGHFAINGFRLNKIKVEENSLSHELFINRFKKIFSGHFHTRGIKKFNNSEIIYIGSPYQLTRGDSNEERGFCVLNLDSLTYEFIDNNKSIRYINLDYPQKFTEGLIKGNIIDVNVKFDKTLDDDKLQLYIKLIENMNPIVPPEIVPINSFVGISHENNIEIKSSSDLMREYINLLEIDNKDEIYLILEKLYEEAMNQL